MKEQQPKRRIESTDASAPLPSLEEHIDKRAEVSAIPLLGHPSLARLHPTGRHPESGGRIAALLGHFDVAVVEPARTEDVLRCHSRPYVGLVATIAVPTWLDGDTPASETTYDAALLSAGAAIEAVRQGGFALARPPGHHALADGAMGFCIFDNAAVAARYAQAELGIGRVVIVDWDVHHGNGTDAIFRRRRLGALRLAAPVAVLPRHRRAGRLDGSTLNVPLHAGSGDADYLARVGRSGRAGRERVRPRARGRVRRLRRTRRGSARRDARDGATASASSRRGRPPSPRGSAPCSRAATTSRRCPASSARRSKGSARGASPGPICRTDLHRARLLA